MSEVLTVLPLGPFPPWTPARLRDADGGEVLDLGAALRDQLLHRDMLAGPARTSLQARLAETLERAFASGADQPPDLAAMADAAELLSLWLDTWPLAGMVSGALSAWSADPTADDLAVLGRASTCLRRALGWEALPGGPWPRPPDGWLLGQTEGRRVRLLGRGVGDHAALVGAALGCPVAGRQPGTLPAVARVAGHSLVSERDRLARALVRGEVGAVALDGPPPPGAAATLALGELRMEGAHQRAWERFGAAGLRVDGDARWEDQLESAPSGDGGAVLQPTAEGLLAPGPAAALARGEVDTVGWLLWDGPFRPLAVHPVAVHVLRALDGERDAAAVAATVQGPPAQVAQVLAELVRVGAATAT